MTSVLLLSTLAMSLLTRNAIIPADHTLASVKKDSLRKSLPVVAIFILKLQVKLVADNSYQAFIHPVHTFAAVGSITAKAVLVSSIFAYLKWLDCARMFA